MEFATTAIPLQFRLTFDRSPRFYQKSKLGVGAITRIFATMSTPSATQPGYRFMSELAYWIERSSTLLKLGGCSFAEGKKEAVDSEQTGATQLVWHKNVSSSGVNTAGEMLTAVAAAGVMGVWGQLHCYRSQFPTLLQQQQQLLLLLLLLQE